MAADLESIDARVRRLEKAVSDLERKADVLDDGQRHLREIVDIRFTGVEEAMRAQAVRIEAVNAKLDGLIVTLQTMVQDNARLASEVAATPAGRAVAAEITELRLGRDENREAIRAIEKKVWVASGAVSAVVFIVNIMAPVIRHALGFPS